MIKFLLILILLAIVLGPLGVIAGLGVGAALLFIVLPLIVLGFLARVLSASGRAIGSAMPDELPPGASGPGAGVRKESDGWYCVVDGERFGPWSDRVIAENVMKVEQRRKGVA
jgi:uncharacterized membrane protein YqaE (UPF0057 family)